MILPLSVFLSSVLSKKKYTESFKKENEIKKTASEYEYGDIINLI